MFRNAMPLQDEESNLLDAEDTDDHGNPVTKKKPRSNFVSIKNKKKDQTPSENSDAVCILKYALRDGVI